MAAGTNPKEKEEEEEEEEEEEKEEEEEEEEEEKEEEGGVIICAQGRKGGMKKVFFSPCPDSLLRTFRGTPLGPARERRRGGGRERVTPTCPHTVHRAKIYLQEQVWLKKCSKCTWSSALRSRDLTECWHLMFNDVSLLMSTVNTCHTYQACTVLTLRD